MVSDPSGADRLVAYRRLRLELADVVMAAMNLARSRQDPERVDQARSVLARLAEDRFCLAVMGQFSRGKSTLMNAVLGGEHLPVGALPMTSVITTVSYGSQPEVLIRHAGRGLPLRARIEDLSDYVTRSGSERGGVTLAEVRVPAEILRLGFYFVDTPGVGSAMADNTATTEGFLPEADAVVFVTSFDSALTESEVSFLERVLEHVGKVFVVVNKADLISEDDTEAVLAFVSARMQERGGGPASRVYGVSARNGLRAKLDGDPAALAASGLPALEAALVEFLTSERSVHFLSRSADRATALVARLQTDLTLASRAGAGTDTRRADFDAAVGAVRDQARALYEELSRVALARFEGWVVGERGRWVRELAGLWEAPEGETSIQAMDAVAAEWLRRRSDALAAVLDSDPGVANLRRQLARVVAGLEGYVTRALGLVGPGSAGSPEPIGLEPVSLEPVSLEPVSLEPVSLEPVSLEPEPPEWATKAELPWWSHLGPAGLTSAARDRRLREAVQQAALAYSRSAEASLADAVGSFTSEADHRADASVRDVARGLWTRLSTDVAEADLSTLRALQERISTVRQALPGLSAPPAGSGNGDGHGGHPSPDSKDAGTEPGPGGRWAEGVPAESPARPRAGGCVVCERLAHALFEHLTESAWELLIHEDVRVQHRSVGLCPLHAWDQVEIGSPVGVSAGEAAWAEAVADALDGVVDETMASAEMGQRVRGLVPDPEVCPACVVLDELESTLVAGIVADDTGDVPPLCLGHLGHVLGAGLPLSRATEAVATTAAVLRRGSEDMRTFAIKREALRASLVTDEEKSAFREVLYRLSGHPLLAIRWAHDSEVADPYRFAPRRSRKPKA